MAERSRQIRYNIAAFALLFVVSLYRQLSLRYLPDDPFRTYILYGCYVVLITAWAVSIHARVTQRGMRLYLMLEAGVMFFGLTVRFLQDTFWYENMLLMRVSGEYISATCLPLVLLGLYGSLGIGEGDDFRTPRRWYWLLVPVLVLVLLNVTDELHHFVTYIVPEEPQPNLIFHPYIGTYLIYALGILIMILRAFQIYKRNSIMEDRPLLRGILPFLESILLLVFSTPYLVNVLQPNPDIAPVEVLEFYAKVYYVEAVTWEFYIYLGLVPTNTYYREIFERSTAGMQLRLPDGGQILSENAAAITAEQLESLNGREYINVAPGKELHIHRLPEGDFLWSEDVSRLQETIEELNRSAETLAQEGILLEEELKTRNQEAGLRAKNQIYDELTGEVTQQLRLMKELVKKRNLAVDKGVLLRQMCLLGTYVKRRCNLRLIQKETGVIDGEDLRLSFQDMVSALGLMGIPAELRWEPGRAFSAAFSICLFDALEYLLEYERFSAGAVRIEAEGDRVCFTVEGSSGRAPRDYGRAMDGQGYAVAWRDEPEGYRMILTEGGEGHV